VSAVQKLQKLRSAADLGSTAFEAACVSAGYADKWAAYHDEANWPEALLQAHRDAMTALHAFYLARDGARGFLGGRSP